MLKTFLMNAGACLLMVLLAFMATIMSGYDMTRGGVFLSLVVMVTAWVAWGLALAGKFEPPEWLSRGALLLVAIAATVGFFLWLFLSLFMTSHSATFMSKVIGVSAVVTYGGVFFTVRGSGIADQLHEAKPLEVGHDDHHTPTPAPAPTPTPTPTPTPRRATRVHRAQVGVMRQEDTTTPTPTPTPTATAEEGGVSAPLMPKLAPGGGIKRQQ